MLAWMWQTVSLVLFWVCKIHRKLKVVLSYYPTIQFLGIHPKDFISYDRDTCSLKHISALFTKVRAGTQP